MISDKKRLKQEYKQALASGNEEAIDQARTALWEVEAEEYNNKNNSKPKDQTYHNNKAIALADKQSAGADFDREVSEDDVNSMTASAKSVAKNNKVKLTPAFYRDVAAAISGKPTGNENDALAKKARDASQNYRLSSAEHGMEAQQHQQIANRNEFGEAGKIASVQNDAENRQNINNTSFAAGTSSARLRKTNAPDVTAQRTYQAEQRNQAERQRLAQQNDRQAADATSNDARQLDIASRDYNTDYNVSRQLSKANGNKNQNNVKAKPETEVSLEPETETSPEASPDITAYNTNWQDVYNYMTYGADDTSKWSQDNENAANAKAYAESRGWTPLAGNEVNNNYNQNLNVMQGYMQQSRPDFYNEWQENSKRFEDGRQLNAGMNGLTSEDFRQNNISSDERIKNVRLELSDINMKVLRDMYDYSDRLTPEQYMYLAKMQGGKYKHDGVDYDFFNDELDDTVLNGYAEFIKNYLYNYKPEAKSVDSSIDPNEDHIGPMAQDIEKVNPACIKETPDGVKTVDTGRLALMNAGAIGDLARQLKELKEVLGG